MIWRWFRLSICTHPQNQSRTLPTFCTSPQGTSRSGPTICPSYRARVGLVALSIPAPTTRIGPVGLPTQAPSAPKRALTPAPVSAPAFKARVGAAHYPNKSPKPDRETRLRINQHPGCYEAPSNLLETRLSQLITGSNWTAAIICVACESERIRIF